MYLVIIIEPSKIMHEQCRQARTFITNNITIVAGPKIHLILGDILINLTVTFRL